MSDLSALNLEAGSLVGGYTLISRLGSGAMGSVWRVRDDGGHQYAMKILRDSLSDDDSPQQQRDELTARERLRREAMALQKVRHPGVCGIVDMELDDALAFIVTELIEGKNLREDVRVNGRYVGDDLERLARKLIEAVRAVHAAGIVHRDIKPTNVMVSSTGPVLVDFGIAMGEGESHVTRTGLVMGTPGFIAPEIIDGAESDEMTDWWSVASVLAFAATGEPVFGTKPMMTVLERAAAGSANLAGLPAGTMAAFRSALNPDRTKRCTPDDLLQAIAVDALNPQAWVAADNGGAADGDTEAMPPFVESPDNPRTLWQSQDDITGENAISTRTMPRLSEATQAIGQPDVSATQVIGKQVTSQSDASATQVIAPVDDAETSVLSDALPNVDSTRTMPQSQGTQAMPTGTQVMPQSMPSTQMLPAQNAWNPAEAPTQVDPTIKPALQRIAMRQPPSVIPQATVAAAQQSPAMSFPPVPGMDGPNVAEAPNPADVKRGAMLGRGMLPCALMADSRGRLRTVLTVDGDGSRVAVRLCAGHHRIQHGGAARARRQTWRREEKFRLAAAIGGTALAHREGLRRRHRADADHVGRGRAGFVAHHGRAAASVCRDGYVDIWIDDSDADAAWRSAFRKRAGAGCVLRDRLACGRGRSGRDRTAIGQRRTA